MKDDSAWLLVISNQSSATEIAPLKALKALKNLELCVAVMSALTSLVISLKDEATTLEDASPTSFAP